MSRIGALATILLALELRAWRLDAQSLWYDEGISIALAWRDLLTITRSAAADIHPPLYYYLLHFWQPLAGQSEFAVRWLSVVFGTLMVALVWAMGRQSGIPSVGPVAALLAAVNPILVYYSQEARMYILVACLGIFTTFLGYLLATGRYRTRLEWLAYITSAIATVYSHYYGLTVLVAITIAGLVILAKRNPKLFFPWLAANTAVGVAFLPWLVISWDQLRGWPAISQPLALQSLVNKVFLAFSFGFAPPADLWPAYLLLVVISGGLASIIWYRRPFGLVAALWVVTPVACMFVASLQRPMYNPKFLLVAVPGYLFVLALGIASWTEIIGFLAKRLWPAVTGWGARLLTVIVLMLILAVPASQALATQQTEPRLARDNYRGIVSHINIGWRDGDAIVLNAPGQIEIFAYYHPDLSNVYPLPARRPLDEAQTNEQLQNLYNSYRRIWMVLWASQQADPQGYVERWLDSHAYKSQSRWFGGVRLALYAIPGASDNFTERSESLSNGITLIGQSLENETARPGDTLGITLRWRTDKTLDRRYKVFAQLLNANGVLWAQHDSEPAGGSKPTVVWKPGEVIEDRHGIDLPLGSPAGQYLVIAGIYEPDTGQRVTLASASNQDHLTIGNITVERPDTAITNFENMVLPIMIHRNLSNEIRLLGGEIYEADAAGRNLKAGAAAHLVLFWQATQAPLSNYRLKIEMSSGQTFSNIWEGYPAGPGYPTDQWQPGELVRTLHRLEIGPPGSYIITVSLFSEKSHINSISIPDIQVK